FRSNHPYLLVISSVLHTLPSFPTRRSSEAEAQQIPSRAPGEEAGFLDLRHEGAEVACELLLFGSAPGTPAFEHLGAGGGIRSGSRQGGVAHVGRVHALNAMVPTPVARHSVERFSTPYP